MSSIADISPSTPLSMRSRSRRKPGSDLDRDEMRLRLRRPRRQVAERRDHLRLHVRPPLRPTRPSSPAPANSGTFIVLERLRHELVVRGLGLLVRLHRVRPARRRLQHGRVQQRRVAAGRSRRRRRRGARSRPACSACRPCRASSPGRRRCTMRFRSWTGTPSSSITFTAALVVRLHVLVEAVEVGLARRVAVVEDRRRGGEDDVRRAPSGAARRSPSGSPRTRRAAPGASSSSCRTSGRAARS